MSLIEGIGDEVLQFFTLFILLIVAVLAWFSTQISERPLLRTVLILERRGTRQPTNDAPIAPSPNIPNDSSKSETPTVSETEPSISLVDGVSEDAVTEVGQSGDASNGSSENRTDVEPTAPIECETSNSVSSQPSEENVIPVAVEATVIEEMNDSSDQPPTINTQNIRIRLKYLNDDQKLVDGNLEEQLGDFKRRHFNLELSARKLVRLIFNGQVLGQDTCTLGQYGLFDNCVVHCLVHNPRTPPPSPNATARADAQRQSPISTWFISNFLLAFLSLLLGFAWYGRFHYAQLFTATTTIALIGLTGVFTLSIVGIYMSDDNVRT